MAHETDGDISLKPLFLGVLKPAAPCLRADGIDPLLWSKRATAIDLGVLQALSLSATRLIWSKR